MICLQLKSWNRWDAVTQTCFKSFKDNFPQKGTFSSSIYEKINDVSPSQNSVILQSIWKDDMRDAKMEQIFTQEGRCFTLNSLSSRKIYTDE